MIKGLVSVIVPVYNREKYVSLTLDSIIQQTYKNIEIIAVNDGSTDSSLTVLKNYEANHPKIITVIDQKNQGQVKSRNTAILKSKGEFIAFLDSDDLWMPNKLEMQLPLFNEQVGLVYSAIENIDKDGIVVGSVLCDESVTGDILPQLLIRNRMTGGTVVVKKVALDKIGLFDEAFSAAENWDLWIRICREYEARLVNMPLVQYRIHPDNMSSDRKLMLSAKENIVNKHCCGTPKNEKVAYYYKQAKADLAYWKGVYYFSNSDYAQSRAFFFEAHSLIPFYEDSAIRIFRSYLGKFGNNFISNLKKIGNKL